MVVSAVDKKKDTKVAVKKVRVIFSTYQILVEQPALDEADQRETPENSMISKRKMWVCFIICCADPM